MRSVFKVEKEGHSYPILKATQLPYKRNDITLQKQCHCSVISSLLKSNIKSVVAQRHSTSSARGRYVENSYSLSPTLFATFSTFKSIVLPTSFCTNGRQEGRGW